MPNVSHRWLFLVALLALVACKKVLKPDELPANIALGATYYTQFVIPYEKGTYLTSNFRRGALIPVNTPVRLSAITTKTIEVELANGGQKLLVKNVEKHTGDDVYHAFDKLFAKQQVNLWNFSDLERQHIQSGTVAVGMRKDAVKVAIGYPPATETMSLASDVWMYWSGRFNKFKVTFANGMVSKIED